MSNRPIYFVGGSRHECLAWQQGAAQPLEWLDDHMLVQATGAPVVIEASLGPLKAKRQRLEQLDALGVERVLTASTTATVAAQCSWGRGRLPLSGVDPLLMMAGGQVQTLVHGDGVVQETLSQIWPDRTFVDARDSVGLVFSREILPIINEAAAFLERDIPSEQLDQALRLGLNYPRGPIAWAELFGWPAVYWGLRALEDMYGPRFRPHPWIRRQVGSSLLEREDG